MLSAADRSERDGTSRVRRGLAINCGYVQNPVETCKRLVSSTTQAKESLCREISEGRMIHGPLDFFGLLPSGLSIVKGIRSRSRWANVHDEIPLTLINDRRHVRAVDGWAPCVRDCAVRAYRIRSRKFDRPNVRARHSYEEFSGETAISIKDEATDRNEPCSCSVETVTAVQGCV